jgi:Tol biopolymer transport system component
VAYASDQSGNFDIWVQPVGGGDAVRVTTSEMPDTQPDWSPDGTRIVFRSEREGGGLFLVPVLGGAEQRLTTQGSRPRWSPDGRHVLLVPGQAVPGAKESKLQVVALDGSAPRDVLQEFTLVIAAEWHPDGRVSVLGFHQDQGLGLFLVGLDGSDLVHCRLTSEATRQIPLIQWVEFAWDPTGTAVYLEAVDGSVQNLWKASIDPVTTTITGVERLTTGPTRDSFAAVSRDGRQLAYSAYSETSRLWTVPVDAAAGRVLGDPAPFTDEGLQVGTSDISPDGRLVVFVVQRTGSLRRDLWLADLDAGTSRPLFQDGLERDFARWAPDGRELVYLRAPARPDNVTLEIVVGDLEGHERVVLTSQLTPRPRPALLPFDWTADGRHLLGSVSLNGESSSAIALWPASGPQVLEPDRILVHDDRYDFWQMRHSPNRQLISFVYVPRRGQGYPAIAVAPAADPSHGRWQRIGADQAWADKPRWSPDGRLLYYLARDERARFNVWATRVDPQSGAPLGRPFQVTRLDQPDLVISPDVNRAEMSVSARRLILTVKKVTGSIWLLDGIK